MSSPNRKETIGPEEALLRQKAEQLVNDGKEDLALRWTFLSLFPAENDFDAEAIAAAWDMAENPEGLQKDLQELLKRELIQFDQKSARYKLGKVLKKVAAELFAK